MLSNDPLWYKDAIIYELHVRAFHDAANDGIGDFRGLTRKLDYLQDLGITAIWLLPFYPSPLRDDGYDIADYTNIHADYGNLRDFREFLRAAHERGLRVITELVVNHTSDQHPWFQRARRAPAGSPERDFYVWSDTPDKYREARIIFKDFEHSNWTWDHIAKAYYWHRFYAHQPDLNYDNPAVWQALFPVVDFWLGMGVDGMRLDAVPYLYEREGTNCENLPETHVFLRALRKHIDERYPNRMLLSEANQWPEDAVVYMGTGDECQMSFHFPVMPRMFMAIHMEDRFPIIDIMNQTPAIPENCQWAMFLRNHDELTLEMVTDEERDYMYRAYASDPRARINLGIRRRLAPLLRNNRRRIELMNGLLFSLPGTPILYYGDEIGMGDNVYLGDRNGVRTPMQWSADRNAGFSRCNPQKLFLPIIIDPEFHYEAINVEAQQDNPNSLLWWMKRLIALRKQYKAFGRGTLEFLHPENRKILAFLRRNTPLPPGDRGRGEGVGEGEEIILVVVNLSRFVQYVELDLADFHSMIPIELFGRTPFPPIGKLPYLLTLGPHGFYWFALHPHGATSPMAVTTAADIPELNVRNKWEDVFVEPARNELEGLLPAYIRQRRWFGSKARTLKHATIIEAIRVPYADAAAYITLVQLDFLDGEAQTYILPLTVTFDPRAGHVVDEQPHMVVARLTGGYHGILYDALGDPGFARVLLRAMGNSDVWEGEEEAEISARSFGRFAELLGQEELPPVISKAEQSNTSILFGNRLIMKVYRRVEAGINPDLEIGAYLSEKGFPQTALVVGAIEYRKERRSEPVTIAMLQGYIPNEGDAWSYTLDNLGGFLERALASTSQPSAPAGHLLQIAALEPPEQARDLIGPYLEMARLLGQRTAELHLVLTAPSDDPHFASEPFTSHYQRSLYQSLRNLYGKVFQQLRERASDVPDSIRPTVQRILGSDENLLRRMRRVLDRKLTTLRSRCHGDYHLGQVLFTGKDFVIIDFEGEPSRSLSERRLKRSPLRDVAGMIRSFHYAAYSATFNRLSPVESPGGQVPGVIRPEDVDQLHKWAHYWYIWAAATFLRAYRDVGGQGSYLPTNEDDFKTLLDALLLEKAIYEVGYELNHRPDWLRIPMAGIAQLIEGDDAARPAN